MGDMHWPAALCISTTEVFESVKRLKDGAHWLNIKPIKSSGLSDSDREWKEGAGWRITGWAGGKGKGNVMRTTVEVKACDSWQLNRETEHSVRENKSTIQTSTEDYENFAPVFLTPPDRKTLYHFHFCKCLPLVAAVALLALNAIIN